MFSNARIRVGCVAANSRFASRYVRSASLADAGSLIRSAMNAPISRKTSSRTVRTSSSLFAKWYEMSPVLDRFACFAIRANDARA
ncbi:hypothetical protein LCL61_02575 [Amycolatopsis coloradensis]|uniref:Uncharacterized protein n=1 Tax=Amycolatopsis coloradensis TaxID=76021 RepID=A0ACD5B4Y9_9PSEU